MTHVDWNPVVVNSYGKIKKGKKPFEMADVFVTILDGSVEVDTYIDDDIGFSNDYLKIIAWAYVDKPEPYDPYDPYDPEGKE